MTWHRSSSPKDRFFACLPYLLPLIEVVTFSSALFAQLPLLGTIYLVTIGPFLDVYAFLGRVIPFVGLIIFFALFLLVVRNERIAHFIRYNTLQAIIISIVISLCSLVLQLFGTLGANLSAIPLFGDVIFNLIFLAVVSASVYSIVQCIRGRYAEIPIISEAVYTQVR
ncbi:MAG: Tic20 family protein [Geitlerinemataceae cyanobacterium]